MNLIDFTTFTLAEGQSFARGGSHDRFMDEMIPALMDAVEKQREVNNGRAINAAVLIAQSAKETGWGAFPGRVKETQFNTAGVKIRNPIADNPEDHETFASWEDGARAHVNHLGAYTGLQPVGTPHGRWHVVKALPWAGTVVKVEELGGRWAPSSSYGKEVQTIAQNLLNTIKPSETRDIVRGLQKTVTSLGLFYGHADGYFDERLGEALARGLSGSGGTPPPPPPYDDTYLRSAVADLKEKNLSLTAQVSELAVSKNSLSARLTKLEDTVLELKNEALEQEWVVGFVEDVGAGLIEFVNSQNFARRGDPVRLQIG